MNIAKYAIPVAAAALIAMTGAASAQSGTAPGQNPQRGPAQEGGRTQATPGPSGSGMTAPGPGVPSTPHSGMSAGQDTHKGPAQEAGRTQATPGGSSSGNAPAMDTTGTVTPRSGTTPGQDTHKGPAQEGGRTQATPGGTR